MHFYLRLLDVRDHGATVPLSTLVQFFSQLGYLLLRLLKFQRHFLKLLENLKPFPLHIILHALQHHLVMIIHALLLIIILIIIDLTSTSSIRF